MNTATTPTSQEASGGLCNLCARVRKWFCQWCRDDDKAPAPKRKDTSATLDALTVILLATTIALMFSVFYGLEYSVRGALLAFLASTLGYGLGGMAGFLFGFPRYTDGIIVADPEAFKKALGDKAAGAGAGTPGLRQNTNLERIVDWLTTMIVGATLVNLQQLTSWSEERFRSLTAAIVRSDEMGFHAVNQVMSATPGMLLVVPFMIGGFLHLYLWARRFLPREWRNAERDLDAEVDKLTETMRRLKSVVYPVDSAKLDRYGEKLKTAGADSATVSDVLNRYKQAKEWSSEPLGGFGPSTADGFAITATVARESSDELNPYRVSVGVARADGNKFTGSVVVLLHNTFDEPVIVAPVNDGPGYTHSFWCADAFAVGAIVVSGTANERKTTRLGIDLAKLPNVPDGFVAE